MMTPLLYTLATIDSSATDEGLTDAMKTVAVTKGLDVAVVGVIMGCLVAITFIVSLALLIWAKGKRRERLVLAAIQSNQPDVAKEIARSQTTVIPWIVGMIIAVVAIINLPWLVTLFLALLAAVYFIVRAATKRGRDTMDFTVERGPGTPGVSYKEPDRSPKSEV